MSGVLISRFSCYYFLQGLLLSCPGLALLQRTKEFCDGDPACVSWVTAWVFLPWHLKLLYGIAIDHWQSKKAVRAGCLACGGRVLPCGLATATVSSLGCTLAAMWLLADARGQNPSSAMFIYGWVAMNLSLAVSDVLFDGWQAQHSRQLSETDRAKLQAYVFTARSAGGGLGALGGGFLLSGCGAEVVFSTIALLALVVLALPYDMRMRVGGAGIRGLSEPPSSAALPTNAEFASLMHEFSEARGVARADTVKFAETVEWAIARKEPICQADEADERTLALSRALRATVEAQRKATGTELEREAQQAERMRAVEQISEESEAAPPEAGSDEGDSGAENENEAECSKYERVRRSQRRSREHEAARREPARAQRRQRAQTIRFARVAAFLFFGSAFPGVGVAVTLLLLQNTGLEYKDLGVIEAIGVLGGLLTALGCWRRVRSYPVRRTLRVAATAAVPLSLVTRSLVVDVINRGSGSEWQTEPSGVLDMRVCLLLGLTAFLGSMIGGLVDPLVQQQAVAVAYKKNEATSFAFLMGLSNLGSSVSGALGALLLRERGVNSANYEPLCALLLQLIVAEYIWSLAVAGLLPPLRKMTGNYQTIDAEWDSAEDSADEPEPEPETEPEPEPARRCSASAS